MQLFSGDVCRIADLAQSTFDDWCRKGIFEPVEGGGEGHGSRRRFTLMQGLGVAVGNAVRQTERGCVLSYVGAIVEAFGAMTEKRLLRHFSKGETHFLMVRGDKPLLRSKQYDWIDVQRIYRDLKKQLA